MADFDPVYRPVPHEDGSHKKDKKTIGTPEKFKDSFRVQEVKATGEEEKKKRKRSEETQMETQAEGLVAPQVPIQSNLSPSPYSVQPPVKKVGSTQATTSSAPQSAPLGSSYSPTAQSLGSPTPTPIPAPTTTTQSQTPSPTPPPPTTTPTTPPTSSSQETLPPQEPTYEEAEPQGQDYFQPTTMPTAPQQTLPSSQSSEQNDQTQQSDETQDNKQTEETQGDQNTQKTTDTKQTTGKKSTETTSLKKGIPGTVNKMLKTGDAKTTIPQKEQLVTTTEPVSVDQTKQQVLEKKLSPTNAQKPTSTVAAQSTDAVISSDIKKPTNKTSLEKTPIDTSSPQKGMQDSKVQQTVQQQTAGNSITDAKPMQVAPPAPPVLRQKDVTVEEAGLSWEGDVQPSSALSSDSSNKDKNDKNDSNSEDQNPESQSQLANMQTPAPFAIDTPATQAAAPTYTTFSPAVLEMFDKMVGTISVLQETSGERKTTVSLTSPNFSSSVFFGSEIVIEEDTHLAPGQYNIKLIGSPEAVNLFQAKRNDLMAAFQEGNYNFRVQRLETSIQGTDKPLFKRKEAAGEDSSKDTGQGE